MQLRLRLAMVAAALLYLGPLLAGLAGFGWAQVPVFALIFLIWLLVMRPEMWPQAASGWTGGALVAAVARAAVQLLLVAVCFGIGRGIGGVMGFLPALPVWVPLALSAIAVVLGRLLVDPKKAVEMDAFLTDAIGQIEGLSQQGRDDPAVVQALLALPDGTPDAGLMAAMDRARKAASAHLTHDLRRVLAESPGHTAARRALILWATDPVIAETYVGTGAITDAFDAAGDDPLLLTLVATRAGVAMQAYPWIWGDCPTADLVREAAARVPQATPALTALIAAMAAVAPDET